MAVASDSPRRFLARAIPLTSLAFLALVAIAPRARAGEATPESAAQTKPDILAADVEARVRYLASPALGGRFSTEPGGFAASDYVAKEFQRFGLKPIGDDGGWFQGFSIPVPVLGTANVLEATVAGAKTPFVLAFIVERDWNPFSLSPKTEAKGTLAFAGYGITATDKGYDDYADFDAKGKVLLVLRKEPPWGKAPSRHAALLSKYADAVKHGAAALLVVNDPRTVASDGDVIWSWKAGLGPAPGSGDIPFAFVSRQTEYALLASTGKDLNALQDACDAAAAAKSKAPAAFDVVGMTVRVHADVTSTTANNARNVVGLLEGSDVAAKDEYVVLGAHHDHVGLGYVGSAGGPGSAGKIHPGADDNASGTAAILEIAEALASDAKKPKRPILFLSFSGEELGLLGSAYYVAHPIVPLDKVSVMVNCDMLGRYRESVGLEAGGVGTGKGLTEIVTAANASYAMHLTWNPSGLLPSDNISFFRKKVPVLSFFTGLHDEYHTPKDTPDTLDYPGEEKATRLVRDCVVALANSPERVAYVTPPATPDEKRAVIGIAPAAVDGEGVGVGAVVPDGPAAKAGIQEGDVIVAMGTATIRGGGDLFQFLTSHKAGDVVEVKVLRGAETKTIRVTLGSR